MGIGRLVKRTMVVCAVFAVCGCAAQEPRATVKPQQAGTPRIMFEESSHDFGTLQYRAAGLTHEFVFRNTGSAVLLIEKVKAG